ncbi:hypothetical protein [Geomicrobium sp. JCM 19037]|uniref:hypothetical protein n=1 Tax=Geomicrobium sp. JCM 19037 TaxID=1460634 RepID=UPI0005A73739|nr:hypothetical protein [Geomicrobium sp. JCM 19037]
MSAESARFEGWIVTYVTGRHMLVLGGDPRSQLFTLRQTFFVLPATLAVTNNDHNEVVDVQ